MEETNKSDQTTYKLSLLLINIPLHTFRKVDFNNNNKKK